MVERDIYVLFEDDLGGALAEESKAGVVAPYDAAHGLADRVESVDLVDLLLDTLMTHLLVVLTELDHEAEQSALGLVADLLRQVALVLGRLQTAQPRTASFSRSASKHLLVLDKRKHHRISMYSQTITRITYNTDHQ